MIYIAQENDGLEKEIVSLSKGNPFGCRILALYRTYDCNLPFVDFWIQFRDLEAVSAICRIDSTFILNLSEKSDMDEISAFIRVSGAASVIADGRFPLECPLKKRSGPIMMSCSRFETEKSFPVFEPTVKEFYSVIKKRESENFSVPSYESFALDVGNKLQKGAVRLLGVREFDFAACIMTLAETDDSAVLGALATDPKFSRRGYGAFLLKKINNILVDEGKRVFLHRAENENIELYNKLGFEKYGIWTEYFE